MATRQIPQSLQRLPDPQPLHRRRPAAHVRPVYIRQLCIHTLSSARDLQGSFTQSLLLEVRAANLCFLQQYEVKVNDYDKAMRLNLYGWDGAPLNPMYLAYKPPQMLPTQTLNPTTGAPTASSQPSGTGKVKRALAGDEDGLVQEALNRQSLLKRQDTAKADRLWWLGISMTALGGVGYFCF